MTWSELSRLKPVAPSMGMMLETTSRRLFETKGLAHYGSPDKDPEVRLRTLDDAGRLSIPFTTGLLVGIGETLHRARRDAARDPQVAQGVRPRPGSDRAELPGQGPHRDGVDARRRHRRLPGDDRRRPAGAGPKMRIQAPPNLVSRDECLALIGAGVDDWGGVSPLTPDHVNPERPWPALDELAAVTAEAGYDLVQRLTAQPPYVQAGAAWIDPRVQGHVAALADPDTGFARGRQPCRAAVAGARRGVRVARPDRSARGDRLRGPADRRPAAILDSAFGDWESIREKIGELAARAPERIDTDVVAALRSAERDPAGCSDDEYLALATADGPALDAVAALADSLRRDTVGDDVTFVVNRNINFTNICYTGCRFCAFAQRKGDADAYSLSTAEVADRAWEAHVAGATEVCMQGGIDPELPVTGYADLVRAVKAAGAVDACARVLADGDRQRRHQERAVDPRVADQSARGRARHDPRHRRRDPRRRGPLGADQGQAADVDVDRSRHHRTRSGAAVQFDDDVRPRRHAQALGRSPARAARHPGPDRRVHRIRAAAVRAPVVAAVPGGRRAARPDAPRQPRRACAGADHAARQDLPHPDQLGQARRRAHPGDAQRRRQRPGRHADGGDHLADGRLGVRLGQDRRRADRRSPRVSAVPRASAPPPTRRWLPDATRRSFPAGIRRDGEPSVTLTTYTQVTVAVPAQERALTTLFGLPAHALLNHAIVVLAPLLAFLDILCALWPAARRRLVWFNLALAAAVVVLTPLTTSAGEWLYNQQTEHSAILERTRSVVSGRSTSLRPAGRCDRAGGSAQAGVARRGAEEGSGRHRRGARRRRRRVGDVGVVLIGDAGAQAVWGERE